LRFVAVWLKVSAEQLGGKAWPNLSDGPNGSLMGKAAAMADTREPSKLFKFLAKWFHSIFDVQSIQRRNHWDITAFINQFAFSF